MTDGFQKNKEGELMLPEIDRSNLAYDLYRDNTAHKEREVHERDRERREREMKLNKPSVSRSGSKAKILFCGLMAFGVLWAVNVQNTRVDDAARRVDDQRALLSEAQDQNSLLQSRLDTKANISYIEDYAGNELGMTKVTNSQIKYLNVNTESLIEVTPDGSSSIFSAVADWFGDLLEYIGF